jgi:hypothetical protein
MAFWFPFGAPEPGAPPCIRHRRLPWTAGDLHGYPHRVLASQRGLASIGPMFRGWVLVIFFLLDSVQPQQAEV